jgi:hypothetical protein
VHALLGDEAWRDFTVITNVRQPWDKMVSLRFFRPARTARFGSGSVAIVDLDDARQRLEAMAIRFTRSSNSAVAASYADWIETFGYRFESREAAR